MEFKFEDILDNVANAADTVFNVLDMPNQAIGNVLDFAYDNTIGELTGTRDLFTGEDAAWVPRIAEMFIPGGALVKGAQAGAKAVSAARNAKNVEKFEDVVSSVLGNKKFMDNAATKANSINAQTASYGKKLGSDSAARERGLARANLTSDGSDIVTLGDDSRGITQALGELDVRKGLDKDLTNISYAPNTKRLAKDVLRETNYIETPVKLYRGGYRPDGMFWTPDKNLAKEYIESTNNRALKRGFDKSELFVLPKGTKVNPGMYSNPELPDFLKTFALGDTPSREVIVLPGIANNNYRKASLLERLL